MARPGSGTTILPAKENPRPVSRVLLLVKVSPQSEGLCMLAFLDHVHVDRGQSSGPCDLQSHMDEWLMTS